MSMKRRVAKLEEGAGGPKPLLWLKQDFYNPWLFTDVEGNEYDIRDKANHWPDKTKFKVIVQVWDKDWRAPDTGTAGGDYGET